MTTKELLQRAKIAKASITSLSTEEKNNLLVEMGKSILKNSKNIIEANKIDIENAKGKIAEVMLDRLLINEERINGMVEGMTQVANLKDPVGMIEEERILDNGLNLKKTRVPMGVVGIIYESRPNVTADAAALCLKSGNICVLRGGKEAINTNKAIVKAMKEGLINSSANEEYINLITDTTRESAKELMHARGFIDVLIPRGGAGLIKACVEESKVPCIETGTGICHIYVDKDADLEKAIKILDNAKTSRPSVCNSAEVCLVHEEVAEKFLPMIEKVLGEKNVEFRLDEKALNIIEGKKATEEDFDTEFLDYILAIKIVKNVEEAVKHIGEHSTGHSESIVSENQNAIDIFKLKVDSAAVYVNASTRFTDGGVFGLGCEMGISTQKLGVRGPMGLYEMTSYKYVIEGDGQIR